MKSALTYERMAQGEVEISDASDHAAVESIQRSNHWILERLPSPPLRSRPRTVLYSLVPLAAVLVAVIGWSTLAPGPDTRAKGAGVTLLLYHKTAAGSELVVPGSVLSEGDEVQAAYLVSERRFAALYSVDGRGTVTVHLPLHGAQAVEVGPPEPTLLPYSYRLDDAPKFETFYLVTSPEPFEVSRLKPFLAASEGRETGVALPSGFESSALRIGKQE